LAAALPPSTTRIAIRNLEWSFAEEQKLFPQFSKDRYFVAIFDGNTRYSITGVFEWGVFGIASMKANRKDPKPKLSYGAR
jgi:hypothetical protein